MTNVDEQIVYQDKNTTITIKKITHHNKTYFIDDIKTVQLEKSNPKRILALSALGAGIFLFILFIGLTYWNYSISPKLQSDPSLVDRIVLSPVNIIITIFIGIGTYFFNNKNTYTIKIRFSDSSTISILSTTNFEVAKDIDNKLVDLVQATKK